MTATRNQERELRRERDRNDNHNRERDHIRERDRDRDHDRSSEMMDNDYSFEEDNTLKGIEKSDIFFLESKSLYNLVLNEIN